MPDMNMMNTPRPNPDDREAAMARADLYKLANYSTKLFKMIQDGDQLEGWVQAKITKAADYIASVYHFMEYEMKFSEYGERLETADMYSESVKREFKRKLTEAKVKLEKLKEKNQKDLGEGWEDMMKANKDREKSKGTGKFDVKKTSTGTQYTRKASTFTDGGDDADTKKAKKKAKETNEGIKDVAKKAMGAVKKAGAKALDKLGHGSDEDMIKDLQKKTGMPQTGKKPMATQNEALKGGQKKLDVDKDGKLEKSDFAKLRANKGVKEASENVPPMPVAKNTSTHGMRDAWMAKHGKTHNANGTPKAPGMMPSDDQSAAEIGRLSDVAGMNAAGKRVPPMPVAKNTSTSSMRDAWMSKYGKTHNANGTPKLAATNEAAKGDKFDPLKHVKNPTKGEKDAAKDVKRGSYADRAAMLKSAEKDGRLKEGSKPDFLDMDKDGNKKEPMKKAVADKKAGPKKGVNPFAKK